MISEEFFSEASICFLVRLSEPEAPRQFKG